MRLFPMPHSSRLFSTTSRLMLEAFPHRTHSTTAVKGDDNNRKKKQEGGGTMQNPIKVGEKVGKGFPVLFNVCHNKSD